MRERARTRGEVAHVAAAEAMTELAAAILALATVVLQLVHHVLHRKQVVI